jgi:hypothetical protein
MTGSKTCIPGPPIFEGKDNNNNNNSPNNSPKRKSNGSVRVAVGFDT